jgi:hypothetical protein
MLIESAGKNETALAGFALAGKIAKSGGGGTDTISLEHKSIAEGL